jgi:hypothetical protein
MEHSIGGYFEWEFARDLDNFPYRNGVLVNSGRYALEYILMSLSPISKIYVPYFTCEVVLEPIKRLNIPYDFYHINEKLELGQEITLAKNDYLIYTDYFGIKGNYVKKLISMYKSNLIVDNSQAFFSKPISEISQFYSPRKFVGCPDGGVAFPLIDKAIPLNRGHSYDRCVALLQRGDEEVSMGYKSFHQMNAQLKEDGMLAMSQLTRKILGHIDYQEVKSRRCTNYQFLHSRLSSNNPMSDLIVDVVGNDLCPMVYPYYTDNENLRKRLIDNRIFVAQYWPNVLSWCSPSDTEYNLTKRILPLPIDQRYGEEDMECIVKFILE